VGFRSFTEPYLDSLGVFKDAILALLATLAKQERIRISERTRAGLDRARLKGARLGRPSTLARWIPDVQRLARQGRGVREIARKLQLPVSSAAKLLKSIQTDRASAVKSRARPKVAVSRPRPRKSRSRI